jgi:hypothetical protein
MSIYISYMYNPSEATSQTKEDCHIDGMRCCLYILTCCIGIHCSTNSSWPIMAPCRGYLHTAGAGTKHMVARSLSFSSMAMGKRVERGGVGRGVGCLALDLTHQHTNKMPASWLVTTIVGVHAYYAVTVCLGFCCASRVWGGVVIYLTSLDTLNSTKLKT